MDKDTLKLLLLVLIGSGVTQAGSQMFGEQPLSYATASDLVNNAVNHHNADMMDCKATFAKLIDGLDERVALVSENLRDHETHQKLHRE